MATWQTLCAAQSLPDVLIRDLVFQQGIIAPDAISAMGTPRVRAPMAHRTFMFDDEYGILPDDVFLRGEQLEAFSMNGGLFIGPMSYLEVAHGLGSPDGGLLAVVPPADPLLAAGPGRLTSFTLVADVSFEQPPARQAALFAGNGVQSVSMASVHSSMVLADDDPAPAVAAAAANDEMTKLHPEMYYRVVVSRDVAGAMHFFVNGQYSHSHHNGDAVDCTFNFSNNNFYSNFISTS